MTTSDRRELLRLAQKASDGHDLDLADRFELGRGAQEALALLSQTEIELRHARRELVEARAEILANGALPSASYAGDARC